MSSLLDLIDAQTAERWNLVSDVVPPAEVMDKAREYARKIASYSQTALKFLKHSFNADTEHIAGVSNIAFDGLDMFVHSAEGAEGRRRSHRSASPTSRHTADRVAHGIRLECLTGAAGDD